MYYRETLTQHEIIRLIRQGVYEVDPETAEVRRGGRVITPYIDGDGRAWIRLYYEGKRRGIARAKLVWMAKTLTIVPKNFEIHHKDEDCRNDNWQNLVCLHFLDHRKEHEGIIQGEIPF